MTVPRPASRPFARPRQWMLDNLSIRWRLALWIASLLALALLLFSVLVYTLAQTQFQNSVRDDIRQRAELIAGALQKEASANGGNSSAPFGGAATPSATAAPAPTPTPQPTITIPGAPPVNVTPTLVPTPNPKTAQNIQHQLAITVPDVLGRLDISFEVLDTSGQPQYLTPSLTGVGLPLDAAAIAKGLGGVPTSYTMRGTSSLLAVYVQPVALPGPSTASTPGSTGNAAGTTPQGATPQGTTPTPTASGTPSPVSQRIVAVVLVAKPLDDINGALATLSHLLLFVSLALVAFAVLGGLFIAKGGLRPIAEVTSAARSIATNAHAAGLDTRVGYRGTRDEVGELVATFNDMLAAIEQSATAQRQFVANASHELRAPLMTIKGSLELLQRRPEIAEGERRVMIQEAFAEAERMALLVNDLLLLARVDAAVSAISGLREPWLDEQLRGRREPVELDQLAMAIFRQGRSQLRAKRKDLHLIVTDLEPVTVLGDPAQLRQVALIILDNAIKYTPARGKIRISATRQGDQAAFSVADTGIGIGPEDQPHIFERFYRADHARARDEHGSGLGLAIAKWIAGAHGGDIGVQSQMGQGSTFTLLLPALPDPEGGRRTGPHAARAAAKDGRDGVPARAPLARLARTISHPISRPRAGPRGKSERDAKRDAKPAGKPADAKHGSDSRQPRGRRPK